MTAKKEARRKRALERFSVAYTRYTTPTVCAKQQGYLARKRQELVALGGDVTYFDKATGAA